MKRWGWLAALVAVVAVLFTSVLRSQASEVTIQWTAPADNVGVVKYDGRYSATKPDTTSAATKDGWWVAATAVTMPAPTAPGTAQACVVSGLAVGTYYFIVQSKDAAGNWSGWSNTALKIVVDSQPPSRIFDLLAR